MSELKFMPVTAETIARQIRRRQWGYEGPRWVAYFWFVSWGAISLGFHVSLTAKNVELHVPFGFFRIGRQPNKEFATWVIARKERLGLS